MAENHIPERQQALIPYLIIKNVASLIEFLQRAFDAEEVHRTTLPDGRIMHAQVRVYGSMVMMGESGGDFRPMPASLYLYVANTDEVYHRALEAGATSVMEPADQFYGDRNAGVKDPAGNIWWIATHIETVTADELQRRAAARVDH